MRGCDGVRGSESRAQHITVCHPSLASSSQSRQTVGLIQERAGVPSSLARFCTRRDGRPSRIAMQSPCQPEAARFSHPRTCSLCTNGARFCSRLPEPLDTSLELVRDRGVLCLRPLTPTSRCNRLAEHATCASFVSSEPEQFDDSSATSARTKFDAVIASDAFSGRSCLKCSLGRSNKTRESRRGPSS